MLARLEHSFLHHPKEKTQHSYAENVTEIARLIDALGVSAEIRGNILLVGCGSGFYEAPIISNDVLKVPAPILPEITSVVGIDQLFLHTYPDDFTPASKIKLYDHTNTETFIERYWNHIPFDMIFMLRIQHLHTQMEVGLDEDIATLLSPDGIAVISGDSKAVPFFQRSRHLQLERAKLINDHSGIYSFSPDHMGFVARKK